MLWGMTDLRGIHDAALSVSDRDASASWCSAVLGFEELFREDGEERRACVMRFPGGGYSVAVVEHVGSDSDVFDPGALASITSRSPSGRSMSSMRGPVDRPPPAWSTPARSRYLPGRS